MDQIEDCSDAATASSPTTTLIAAHGEAAVLYDLPVRRGARRREPEASAGTEAGGPAIRASEADDEPPGLELVQYCESPTT